MAKLISRILIVLLIILVAGYSGACKKRGTPAESDSISEEQLAAEEAAAEEDAAAAAAAKPAPPKVTDEVYIDLTVQSILARERNKDDPAAAEAEILALYESAGVTVAEVKAFEQKLSPAKSNELQKKIQEKLQPYIR